MEKIDEILFEVKELKGWLYGSDGHEGDIIEIKAGLKNHSRKIRRIELILAGTGAAGGIVAGAIKLLA